MLYGQRRLGTVAREMVLLHEMKWRDAHRATRIECKGAFWQAFRGRSSIRPVTPARVVTVRWSAASRSRSRT